MLIDVDKIGKSVLDTVLQALGVFLLLIDSLKRLYAVRLASVRMVIYKQIYFTGIETWGKLSAIAALIGVVIITQIANLVGHNAVLIGKILVWTIVRELGPLFSAILIVARSSPAVAAELGSMKVTGEVDSLRHMGIDPMDYLIMPRVLGMTISVTVLAFYFQMVAIYGGLFLSSLLTDMAFMQQMDNIFASLGLFEILVSLAKSFIFGLLIASASCYQGLRVKSSITEIPQATTLAVMQSLFFIFVSDGIITLVSFI